jgi:hypothetical protein
VVEQLEVVGAAEVHPVLELEREPARRAVS